MQRFESKSMKRMAAFLLCGAMFTAAATAQDTPPPPPQGQTQQGPPPGGPGGPGRGNPARRLEMLQKRLNLTPEQTAKVKAIQDDGRAKMEALRGDSSLEPRARREKLMALAQEESGKVRAVLTDDQKKQFDEMEAQQRERMRERRDGGGPGGPPNGAPGGDTPPPPPPPQNL